MEEIECNNVVEFMSKLSQFGPALKDCFFRGQGDARWSLLPALWRGVENKDDFVSRLRTEFKKKISYHDEVDKQVHTQEVQDLLAKENIEVSAMLSWIDEAQFENWLLTRFYHVSNLAGLPIPDEDFQMCTILKESDWTQTFKVLCNVQYGGGRTVYGFLSAMLEVEECMPRWPIYSPAVLDGSLPQHHGLPTRYLDWTSNSQVAAFFAAYQYLNEVGSKSEKICVIVLKEKQKNRVLSIEKNFKRYKNKFLHAQQGLFTRAAGEAYYLRNKKWPSLEDLASDHIFELKKYTLPVSAAEELLEGLRQAGVSLSTLMPDYKGVVEHLHLYKAPM